MGFLRVLVGTEMTSMQPCVSVKTVVMSVPLRRSDESSTSRRSRGDSDESSTLRLGRDGGDKRSALRINRNGGDDVSTGTKEWIWLILF